MRNWQKLGSSNDIITILSWHLPGRMKEDHKTFQAE
jgi:hypothetical protein